MTEIVAPLPQSHLYSPAQASSYFLPPTPPPATISSRGSRRPSISVAMSWLTHKSSSSTSSLNASSSRFASLSAHHEPTHAPLRISEPRMLRSLDDILSTQVSNKPNGRALGRGAEIVATPQQALQSVLGAPPKRDLPPIPASPPPTLRPSKSSPHLPQVPPREAPPTLPPRPPTKPTAQVVAPITPIATPQLAALSLVEPIPGISDLPAFEPVLLSSASAAIPSDVNASQFLVTIETSTSSLRTTLKTLMSQPSHLRDFFQALTEKKHDVDSPSSETTPSPFTKAFNSHLESEGVTLPSSVMSRLHVFLDRPSAPYNHIVAYLRMPTASTPALPRAIQINPHSSSCPSTAKLETLLELRDEAVYLGLDKLEKLCEDEIRTWFSLKRSCHTKSGSNGSGTPRSHRRERSPGQRHNQVSATSTLRDSSTPQPESAGAGQSWNSEFGPRSSMEGSTDSHDVDVQLPMHSPPPCLTSQAPNAVGLGLRTRSRSNSRSENSPRPRPTNPPAASASRGIVRVSNTPNAALPSSSPNWI